MGDDGKRAFNRRPRSAPMRKPRKHMTVERAEEIMKETEPVLYRYQPGAVRRRRKGQEPNPDGRQRLPPSPLVKKSQQKMDRYSARARFEVLRLHDYIDMPDVPTNMLGAREQAKTLYNKLQKEMDMFYFLNTSQSKFFQTNPLTRLYSHECSYPEWFHLQVPRLHEDSLEGQTKDGIEKTVEDYNNMLKSLIPFYQKIVAQSASLCKERGEVMAGAWVAYMEGVKYLYEQTYMQLVRQIKASDKSQGNEMHIKIEEIEALQKTIENLRIDNKKLNTDAKTAFREQSDFIGATESLVAVVKSETQSVTKRLTALCESAIDRLADSRYDDRLSEAEIDMGHEQDVISRIMNDLNELQSTHPAARCRTTANLSEAFGRLVGRVTRVLECVALNERNHMSGIETSLKKNIDEVNRLKTLSNSLKRQVEEQNKLLSVQKTKIEKLDKKVNFYRGENVTYRGKIKELKQDLKVAEETIVGYEHLLDGNASKLRERGTQTENEEDEEEKKLGYDEIDFIKLAAQGFQIDSNITMPPASHKKFKKKKKKKRDPESTIEKYIAAQGTFFGALARASKPPRKVFLKKGKKRSDDQNTVKIIPVDNLMDLALEIILAKLDADRADDRMLLPRQSMTDFLYDYFLNLYGNFKIADERIVSLMASISTHREKSSRLRMFERFCEIGPGPFLGNEALNFYMLCWERFMALHSKHHGDTWHSIQSGEERILEATAKLVMKQTVVPSNLKPEKADALGPYVVKMKQTVVADIYKNISSMLPVRLDTFLDMLVAEHLKAGKSMEKAMTDIYEETKRGKHSGLTLDEFRALVKKIDPTIPGVRVASLFHSGLASSKHGECLDIHSFKILVRSSRRLLQYVSEGVEAFRKGQQAIYRKNKEDLAELELEWSSSLPKLESEMFILAQAGAEVVGDDKWYNRAMRYRREFEKALAAAKEVNDASVAWAAYSHLLEVVENGLQKVSAAAIRRAQKKNRISPKKKPEVDEHLHNKRKYKSVIDVGLTAMWVPMSSVQRHELRRKEVAEARERNG